MLMRIAILLGLALTVLGSAAITDVIEDASLTDREGKFWWPNVAIVSMWNTSCTTTGGYQGWCFKDTECLLRGGVPDGDCAPDAVVVPGVCCDMHEGGNTTISASGEAFQTKGYPTPNGRSGVTEATLEPPSGTVQIKLTFDEFDLTPPVDGDCTNDTFVFEGANSNVQVPVLCGYNTGQHMYIDVDNSEGPWKLIANLGDGDYERSFKVTVDYLSVTDSNRAPFRCLQYYPEKEGKMSSFNYNEEEGKDSMMLNNQMYPICFGYVSGYCDIAITAKRLDLGNINAVCDDDYVRVGCQVLCGDVEDVSITANATGPITMLVRSDDENSQAEEGFCAEYMMLPCE